MLKETPNSLRLYFGIIAFFSLISGVAAIAQGGGSLFVLVLALAGIGFGLLFAYIVIKFSELLPKRPTFINQVLGANLALSVVLFVLSLRFGLQAAMLFRFAIAVLIYFYLTKSVTRLSAEARPPNA